MASVKNVVLECDGCGCVDDAETPVKTYTVTVDTGSPTKFEACDPCWEKTITPVRALMAEGRKVGPARRRKRAQRAR